MGIEADMPLFLFINFYIKSFIPKGTPIVIFRLNGSKDQSILIAKSILAHRSGMLSERISLSTFKVHCINLHSICFGEVSPEGDTIPIRCPSQGKHTGCSCDKSLFLPASNFIQVKFAVIATGLMVERPWYIQRKCNVSLIGRNGSFCNRSEPENIIDGKI